MENFYICPDCGAKSHESICSECSAVILHLCVECFIELTEEDTEENVCNECLESAEIVEAQILESQNNLDLNHR